VRPCPGVDLRERLVVEIADPDVTPTRSDRTGTKPYLDLGDDLVRLGINGTDVIGPNLREAAAGAAGREHAGEGHQSRSGEPGGDERGPPSPPRNWRGSDRRLGLMTKRRELGRQAVCVGLEEPHRAIEVLEPLLAQVSERDMQLLLLVHHQRVRRL
jgi:hypothetical protein